LKRDQLRRIVAASAPGTTVLYITLLTAWIDRALAALITGPVGLGTFASASYIPEALLRVPRSASNFTIGAYARLARDPESVARLLDSHVRLFSSLLLLPAIVVIAGAHDLMSFLFGPGFASAGTALQLLAASLVPIGISYALATSGAGTRELRLPAPLILAIMIMQVALGAAFGLPLGIAGVALGQAIGWSAALIVYVSEARSRTAAVTARTVARIVALTMPLALFAFVLERQPVPLVVRIVVAGVVTLVGIAVVVVGPPERAVARRLLPGTSQ